MFPSRTVLCAVSAIVAAAANTASGEKPAPDACIERLSEGNARFAAGRPEHPHLGSARLHQAGTEDQGDHAFATVLSCSDSRVPVELIFDAGIMDLFVIRVAGNVCDTDEAGSIEYGLAHVKTPVLVVLGHSQCGAVTAVTHAVQGEGHVLERNIPPLVQNIEPAVRRAMSRGTDLHGADLIEAGIEENVWQSIEDLFVASPSTRKLVRDGKAKVVGAVYDVGAGTVTWLSQEKALRILDRAERNPERAIEPFAQEASMPDSTAIPDPRLRKIRAGRRVDGT